jgi:hypothetical protein
METEAKLITAAYPFNVDLPNSCIVVMSVCPLSYVLLVTCFQKKNSAYVAWSDNTRTSLTCNIFLSLRAWHMVHDPISAVSAIVRTRNFSIMA